MYNKQGRKTEGDTESDRGGDRKTQTSRDKERMTYM